MTAGSALPAGKDWARRSLAAMASGFWRNWSDGLESGVDRGDAGRHDGEDDERDADDALRVGGDRGRRPGARASGRRRGPPRPRAGTLGQKIQRSKMTSAAGSTSEDEGGGDDDADGAGEAEAARGREEREQQGEQAEDDGGGAREHGLGRAAQGERHGLAPVVRGCAARRGSAR